MLKVAIRVSNAYNSGLGHIQRCIQIRRFIKYKVIWFIDEKNEFIKKKINKKDPIVYERSPNLYDKLGYNIKKHKIKVILLDSYHISSSDLYKKIKNKAILITLKDKLDNTKSDITIVPQPFSFNLNNLNTFIGTQYIPISKSLLNNNKMKEKNTIIISMGAYDKNGLTLKIIDIIKNISFLDKKYQILVILGKYSPNIKKARDKIIGLKSFSLLVDKKNMNSVYKKTLFAIGAPGISHTERLAAGVPTILLSQNTLHNKIIDEWVKLNCAIKSEPSDIILSKSIEDIYFNNNLRKKIIEKGRELIDGNGANRIAKIINSKAK